MTGPSPTKRRLTIVDGNGAAPDLLQLDLFGVPAVKPELVVAPEPPVPVSEPVVRFTEPVGLGVDPGLHAREHLPAPVRPGKPPYRIPSMKEIFRIPIRYRSVSTFSGAGGSSLGLRWAGISARVASEFVPEAQRVYRANFPETTLLTTDIRKTTVGDIRAIIGPDELDILEGSPPCASFSTAGKRAEHWGQVKNYSGTKQRTDDLFGEFTRLLAGLQPRVFVAENVSGLVKGVAKGYFVEILTALRNEGYQVEARLLNAAWLGVPQARERMIFIGVRNDLGLKPRFPTALPYQYSIRDALPHLAGIEGADGFSRHEFYDTDRPMDTLLAGRPVKTTDSPWEAGSKYAREADVDDVAPTVLTHDRGMSQIVVVTKKSERSLDLPAPTVQTHGNRKTESELTLAHPRARSAPIDGPSPTVLASDGGWSDIGVETGERDGARRFTIAELKAVCGFPDDFVLLGTYAQQWERLGRAVPPPMYYQVGLKLVEILDAAKERR